VQEKVTHIVHGAASTKSAGDITHSPYSAELNAAYLRAYSYGITTMPTVQQANLQ